MAGPVLGRLLRAALGKKFVTANLPMLHKRTVEEKGQSEYRHGIRRSDDEIDLSGLQPADTFTGTLNYMHGRETNIIASLPIENFDLRLNVHQDMKAIKSRANELIRPLIILGFIVTVLLAGTGHAQKGAVPRQIRERSEVDYAVILPEVKGSIDPSTVSIKDADYLMLDL